MGEGPEARLRRWAPHAVLVVLLFAATGLLLTVLAPLRDPLLLAASLVALTYPYLFEPFERGVARFLPGLGEAGRRHVAGILSTAVLAACILAPVVLVLLAAVGSFGEIRDGVLAVASGDREGTAALVDALVRRARESRVLDLLPFSGDDLRGWLLALLGEARNFGPAFVDFLFRGTGGLLASLVLALLICSTFYARGGRMVEFLLHYTPLEDRAIAALGDRHRRIVRRLMGDVLAVSLIRGAAIGLAVWLCAGFNPVFVALVAAFFGLVPVIGAGLVWIPLAMVEWGAGERWSVAALVGACLAVHVLVSRIRRRFVSRDVEGSEWLGFVVFLGLVGGILAYGPKGLVIGPMIVVLAVLLMRYFLPLYGIGEVPEDALRGRRDPQGRTRTDTEMGD